MDEDAKRAFAESLKRQMGAARAAPARQFFLDHEDAHAHNTASARDMYLNQFNEMLTDVFHSFQQAWRVK